MIYVVQLLIIYAVIAANIHWQATPNPLIPGAAGVGLAYLLTVSLPRWLGVLRAHGDAKRLAAFRRRCIALQDEAGGDGPGLAGITGQPGEALEQWPRPRVGNNTR